LTPWLRHKKAPEKPGLSFPTAGAFAGHFFPRDIS